MRARGHPHLLSVRLLNQKHPGVCVAVIHLTVHAARRAVKRLRAAPRAIHPRRPGRVPFLAARRRARGSARAAARRLLLAVHGHAAGPGPGPRPPPDPRSAHRHPHLHLLSVDGHRLRLAEHAGVRPAHPRLTQRAGVVVHPALTHRSARETLRTPHAPHHRGVRLDRQPAAALLGGAPLLRRPRLRLGLTGGARGGRANLLTGILLLPAGGVTRRGVPRARRPRGASLALARGARARARLLLRLLRQHGVRARPAAALHPPLLARRRIPRIRRPARVLRPARARAPATSSGSAVIGRRAAVRDARDVFRRVALRAPRLARDDADHPAHGVLPERAHRLLHEGEANHVHDPQANRLDHVRLVPDILLLVHEHDRALGRELREPRAHRRRSLRRGGGARRGVLRRGGGRRRQEKRLRLLLLHERDVERRRGGSRLERAYALLQGRRGRD